MEENRQYANTKGWVVLYHTNGAVLKFFPECAGGLDAAIEWAKDINFCLPRFFKVDGFFDLED